MDLKSINQTITSIRIAEISGKSHDNVLKSIRSMESSWVKINGVKFNAVEYKDAKGEKRPMYLLNFEESLYVASKYDDETRARIIKHWSELRQAQNADSSLQKAIIPAIAELGKVSPEIDRLYFKLSENPDFVRYLELQDRKNTLNKVVKEFQKAIRLSQESNNILSANLEPF